MDHSRAQKREKIEEKVLTSCQTRAGATCIRIRFCQHVHRGTTEFKQAAWDSAVTFIPHVCEPRVNMWIELTELHPHAAIRRNPASIEGRSPCDSDWINVIFSFRQTALKLVATWRKKKLSKKEYALDGLWLPKFGAGAETEASVL